MVIAGNFKKLSKIADNIIKFDPDIRDTNKYKNMKSIFYDKTMSCSKNEAISSLCYFMSKARVSGDDEYFMAAFDIYCGIIGSSPEGLIEMISAQHQSGTGSLKWYDIWDSEEHMIWDMLRVHSNPELFGYSTVRGYEYINSFKKYFLLYKRLTEKQINVLKSHLFIEIAYNLYCNKGKEFMNDKTHCSIINNLLQSQYVIDNNEVNHLFDLIGNYCVDAITLYDDGSNYVLLVEEYISGDSVTPGDTNEHTYVVDPDTLELFNNSGRFKNLQKIVLSMIEMANMYVGPVDIIRVEKGSKYKGYVGLATGMNGFTEFLPYSTESGIQTSFVIM